MDFHVLRLSVSGGLNPATFYSRRGLSGSVVTFRVLDGHLMIYTFPA